jgi:3(or 17)beta-hydroxysteroid dehydrogenase
MKRLNDKVAMITGAARRIGAAIARAFVAEGARVYVTDVDDAVLVASLGAAVVNNAGITGFEQGRGPHDPENASLDDWHAVHRTSLDACSCAQVRDPGRRRYPRGFRGRARRRLGGS